MSHKKRLRCGFLCRDFLKNFILWPPQLTSHHSSGDCKKVASAVSMAKKTAWPLRPSKLRVPVSKYAHTVFPTHDELNLHCFAVRRPRLEIVVRTSIRVCFVRCVRMTKRRGAFWDRSGLQIRRRPNLCLPWKRAASSILPAPGPNFSGLFKSEIIARTFSP